MTLQSWTNILCESLADLYDKPININSEDIDNEYPLKVKRTMSAHFICNAKPKEGNNKMVMKEEWPEWEEGNKEIDIIKEEDIKEEWEAGNKEIHTIKEECEGRNKQIDTINEEEEDIEQERVEEKYIKEEFKTENANITTSCGNTWSSQFGSVQFEYQVKTSGSSKGGIIRIQEFGQSCKKCCGSFMPPSFSRQDAKAAGLKLKEKIMEKFYGATPRHNEPRFSTPKGLNQPHESGNCEACRKGLCSWGGEHQQEERLLAKPNKQNNVEFKRNGVSIYVKWKLEVGDKTVTLGGMNRTTGIKRKANTSKLQQPSIKSLKDNSLLKCTICGEVCKKAATLSCCKAQCCRECGRKKLIKDRMCWLEKCGTQGLRPDQDLQNDTLLREAVQFFRERGKMDSYHYKVLKGRKDEEEDDDIFLPAGNQDAKNNKWEGIAKTNKWLNVAEVKEIKPETSRPSTSNKWKGLASVKTGTKGRSKLKGNFHEVQKRRQYEKWVKQTVGTKPHHWKPMWQRRPASENYDLLQKKESRNYAHKKSGSNLEKSQLSDYFLGGSFLKASSVQYDD